MPAGDIVVMAVCLVIVALLATSFTIKTRTYVLFLNMLAYLFLAAASDMILHDYYANKRF